MGRNNQQRRAAKARAKATRSRQGGEAFGQGGGSAPRPIRQPRTVADRTVEWLVRAVDAVDLGRDASARSACGEIIALATTPAARLEVTAALTTVLTDLVDQAWRLGWAPIDLYHFVGRGIGAEAHPVLADLIAHQLARHATGTLAESWPAQLEEIGASAWWAADHDPLRARAEHRAGGLGDVVWQVARLTYLLRLLPELPRLEPLPGTARPRSGASRGASAVDDRILHRVRALLAKAESTTFEAEAETFTAGAQALMARHSIDTAMLAESAAAREGGSAQAPSARRLWINRPYEAPKVLLLHVVAKANRCRTVWSKELGFVTLVGHHGDLAATETIFTSLLVQATSSMHGHGSRTTWHGRSRTTSFRRTFLAAFADRIGERLREVTEEETTDAVARADAGGRGTGQELVRVLTARAEAVDERVTEIFPGMTEQVLARPTDPEGWAAGRRAADQASLFDDEHVVAGHQAG